MAHAADARVGSGRSGCRGLFVQRAVDATDQRPGKRDRLTYLLLRRQIARRAERRIAIEVALADLPEEVQFRLIGLHKLLHALHAGAMRTGVSTIDRFGERFGREIEGLECEPGGASNLTLAAETLSGGEQRVGAREQI